MLVDDEPLITKGLEALLDWEDYGFEIVHIAEDGEEALEYLKEHPIHLLVTDILMPKRTGLSLIEEAKKIQPQLKCIVLSGYQEFDYVKKGMVLGIENYLLKPVDEEELLKTVQAVSIKLSTAHDENAEFTTLKDNILWRLLNGEIQKNEWHERLSLYGMNFSQPFYCVSILEYERENDKHISKSLRAQIEENYPATCLHSPDQELLIIFDSDDEEKLYDYNQQLADFLKESETGKFYLSMGKVAESMDELEESYLEARELSLYQITIEPNSLISDRVSFDRQGLLSVQQSFQEGMAKRILRSKEEAFVGIDLFYQTLMQQEFVAPAVARKYTIDIISYIHHSIRDVKHYHHTGAIEKVVFAVDIEQMREILSDYCSELIDTIDNRQENRSPIVQNVLEYMHAHYDEELSLKTLSQRFHVNPIYLGQLFQKEIGVVFSEYINRYRLEKAKELLKTTHLRAGEIGKKVGYADTAYFYKQFKKNVGATPTEWRNL